MDLRTPDRSTRSDKEAGGGGDVVPGFSATDNRRRITLPNE